MLIVHLAFESASNGSMTRLDDFPQAIWSSAPLIADCPWKLSGPIPKAIELQSDCYHRNSPPKHRQFKFVEIKFNYRPQSCLIHREHRCIICFIYCHPPQTRRTVFNENAIASIFVSPHAHTVTSPKKKTKKKSRNYRFCPTNRSCLRSVVSEISLQAKSFEPNSWKIVFIELIPFLEFTFFLQGPERSFLHFFFLCSVCRNFPRFICWVADLFRSKCFPRIFWCLIVFRARTETAKIATEKELSELKEVRTRIHWFALK